MSKHLKFDLTVEPGAAFLPQVVDFYSKVYISENIAGNYRLLTGVKNSKKLANVVFDDLTRPFDCDFTATASLLDAKTFDVCSLSAQTAICQTDLEESFDAHNLLIGANNGVPSTGDLMSYFWDTFAKAINEEISILRWQGNKGGTGGTFLDHCDGYITKMLADPAILRPSGQTTITSANVIAELSKSLQKLPGKVQAKVNDVRIRMSADVYIAYKLATAAGNNQAYVTQALGDFFLGYPVILEQGLTPNTIVISLKDDLIYAMDGEQDQNDAVIVDMLRTSAIPVLRARANYRLGNHYVNPEQIVLYYKA